MVDPAARQALGERVQLHVPVTALRRSNDGVEVETGAGERLRARTAIVALPVTAWRALAVEPPLEPARLEALAAVRMGHVVKAHVAFDGPWWRAREDGPLPAATDTACGHVYEARVTADGAALACFVGAAAARALYRLDPEARPGAVLGALEDLLGTFPERPRGVQLDAWNESPWTAGSYLVYRTGELTRFRDALARPDGAIVAAGAEASSMPSYIGGAAEAGARAATAALARS
jgi:monoamine oxidase